MFLEGCAMISSTRVGNQILRLAKEAGVMLTPLQVMKLAYMAHGWHMATHGDPLVNEQVQAWQYGPVLPDLYRALKHFGSGAVDPSWLSRMLFDRTEPTDAEASSIKSIFDVYGRYSGPALSNLTHKPGSPWSQIWRPGVTNLVIPNDLIRQHYIAAKNAGVLASA
jgi:uncharacterized phage-associated protein